MSAALKSRPQAKAPPAARRPVWVIPAAGVLLLTAACCVLSMFKPFWTDEFLSYYLLTDSSFSHMLAAQRDLINSAPPLYFVLGWVWAHLFGGGELALRLFSSLGLSAAFVILWTILRRAYGPWPATLAAFVGFFASTLVQSQNVEARSYGLLLAEITLAIWLYTKFAAAPRPSWQLLLAQFLVHAALVNTHYLAFFYSGAILAAFLLHAALERRLAWRAPAALLLGWLTFLPSIPTFIRHSEFGRPHGWIPFPTVLNLLDGLEFGLSGFAIYWAALALLWALLPPSSPPSPPSASSVPSASSASSASEGSDDPALARALLVMAAALLLVPLGMWTYSRLGSPVFHPRYTYACLITWAILWAHVAGRILHRASRAAAALPPGARRTLLAALPRRVFLLLIGVAFVAAVANVQFLRENTGDDLEEQSLPIAVESMHTYLSDVFYARAPERYVYPVDWETAILPQAARSAANDVQIMQGLERQYPERFQVVPLDDFLARHDRFIVLKRLEPQWFDRRLRNNPAWRVRKLSHPSGLFYLVEKAAP